MKLSFYLVLMGLFLQGAKADSTNSPVASEPTPAPATIPDATAIDPVKEAEIRKMIKETGTLNTMQQVIKQMTVGLRAQYPSLPEDFWNRLDTEMNMNELLEQLVPVYAKYYTFDDLKAINAFNESPAGQHMIAVRPQLLTDSMQIGRAWGGKLGRHIMEEVQAEKAKSDAGSSPPIPPAPAIPASSKPASTSD
jgi:hypothetical protein